MVKFLVALAFAFAFSAFDSILAADATNTIDLGGLRQAKAALTVTNTDYVVKVRMLPVHCFDAATNTRLNRDKARELALQALAKQLSTKEAVEVFVSGVQIDNVGTDGKFYTLALRVPRKGVSVVRQGEAPPAKQGEDRVAFTSELFTRKRDYLNTVEKLSVAVLADMKMVEAKAAKEVTPTEAFNLAIAAIEEQWVKNLENLGKEIKSDLLLLSVEQEELNEALDKVKTRMLGRLKEAVKKQAEKEKSP